ncbi:molybdopterin converting factor subunit 1 [Pelagibacterium montanilacus]|uniref:molybdopterin converting factor subunit 1 n=1 Tax=Pelagibacterium montanilacus TaxID=2185280 RepID=UPI000F8DAE8D|nr:molybdopterin converting factor subunit 1 [Pelagibacterium montanilacus]
MRVLYFAWLRERLNRDFDEVDPPESVTSVAQLMDWLAGRDEAFALATQKRELIRAAVDDTLVGHETAIAGARTVALFPPMTGG